MGKLYKPLKKPRADFPLTAHPQGYWVKKIKGVTHYIGPRWCSASVAEAIWNRDKEYLLKGQDPADFYDADGGNGYTLGSLCNDFKAFKLEAVEDGELARTTYLGYTSICDMLLSFFGQDRTVDSLTTGDFDRLRKHVSTLQNGRPASPKTINNFVLRIKVVFNYANDADKIETPVKFGLKFKQVSAAKLRKYQNKQPTKLYSVEHLKAVLDAASDNSQMRAMILLGINCGFGNADVGALPFDKIDLKAGWHDFGRPKTGVNRRGWLWPETVGAIKIWLAERAEQQARRVKRLSPNAKRFEDNSGLVFLTRYGYRWYRDSAENPLSAAFRKLSPPMGLGFYCLRHSFATIGAECDSQIAVDYIMGHAKTDMPSHYRQQINDKSLKAVSQHVRKYYKAALR